MAVEEAPSFTRGYLNPQKKPVELEYGGEPKVIELKKEEIKIISLLCLDSRISLLDIAKKVNLTSEAVRQKLKKFEKSKIIQHYGVILNTQNAKGPFFNVKKRSGGW